MTDQGYIQSLPEASPADFALTCIYHILICNDLACSMICDFCSKMEKSPRYRFQIKQGVKKLVALTRQYEKMVIRTSSIQISLLADICQSFEERISGDIADFRKNVERVFEAGGQTDPKLMAYAEVARTFADYACYSLDKRIQEMKTFGVPDYNNPGYLRMTLIRKQIDEITTLLYNGTSAPLNKDLGCISAYRTLGNKLVDIRIMAECIEEAKKLNQ